MACATASRKLKRFYQLQFIYHKLIRRPIDQMRTETKMVHFGKLKRKLFKHVQYICVVTVIPRNNETCSKNFIGGWYEIRC